jgi:hypothetical protein
MNKLTQQRLKELVHYDADTGIFTWRTSRNGASKGVQAGTSRKNMYVQIMIDRVNYVAHRLAWLYIHGEWPNVIDHINRDKTDNRLCNLRNGNYRDNAANSPISSDFPGVCFRADNKRYRASIHIDGKRKDIGSYKTHFAACYARHCAEVSCTH